MLPEAAKASKQASTSGRLDTRAAPLPFPLRTEVRCRRMACAIAQSSVEADIDTCEALHVLADNASVYTTVAALRLYACLAVALFRSSQIHSDLDAWLRCLIRHHAGPDRARDTCSDQRNAAAAHNGVHQVHLSMDRAAGASRASHACFI